jgi:hypothetical protein
VVAVKDGPRARAPLFEIEIAVSLRLELSAPPHTSPPGFEVRELTHAERSRVLGASLALARRAESIDAVAPSGWRCFVAFEDGRAVHVSYVELRARAPLLFGAVTEPSARGRGAFRATVAHIAVVLRAAGESSLWSWTRGTNHGSMRAHRAAGFEIARRSLDARVLGRSARDGARRLLRAARRARGVP